MIKAVSTTPHLDLRAQALAVLKEPPSQVLLAARGNSALRDEILAVLLAKALEHESIRPGPPRESNSTMCSDGEVSSAELAEALVTPGLDPIIWRKRILVIDDFPAVLEFLRVLLSQKGAEVEAQPNLASARAQLEKKRFDLVLSDISLPDGDGFELFTDLERLSAKSVPRAAVVPLILTTGFGYDETHAIVNVSEAMRAKGMGELTVLYKPFKDEELTLNIHRVLCPHIARTSAA